MIIRVKPLGHFQRNGRTAAISTVVILLADSARHRKISCQVNLSAFPMESLRHCTNQSANVEHLIVKTEIVGRNEVNPGRFLNSPVFGTDDLGSFEQLRFTGFLQPEGFEGAFEFPLRPNSREAQVMCSYGLFHFSTHSCDALFLVAAENGCSDSEFVKR